MRRNVFGLMECQSKVTTDTNTITATNAAMGICATRSPRTTMRMSRKNPAEKVDRRERAPALTLIIVWPIIAHEAMPPKNPTRTLPMPWPAASRVLFERVSVASSTTFAVMSDSSRPTAASPAAYGAMTASVSRLNGTSGRARSGRPDGRSPMSPTFGTAIPKATVTTVSATIAINGDGTALKTRGRPQMTASPPPTRAHTIQPSPQKCGICAMKIKIARALMKPVSTLRGMNRISLATPVNASTAWIRPARIVAAMRYPTPWEATSGATTSAIAPVAAETMAGRPPRSAIEQAMTNEANNPTRGSTPAMIENAIASGIRASATRSPASSSVRRNGASGLGIVNRARRNTGKEAEDIQHRS
ncbi:hypothetical protein GCM10029992_50660 [Glycomyces albus]